MMNGAAPNVLDRLDAALVWSELLPEQRDAIGMAAIDFATASLCRRFADDGSLEGTPLSRAALQGMNEAASALRIAFERAVSAERAETPAGQPLLPWSLGQVCVHCGCTEHTPEGRRGWAAPDRCAACATDGGIAAQLAEMAALPGAGGVYDLMRLVDRFGAAQHNAGYLARGDNARERREAREFRSEILKKACAFFEAAADRDALLGAIGFKPGPLGETERRDVILRDAAGLRPAMVAARRAQRDAEGDALLWRCSIGEGRHPPLLVRIWQRAKAAEAELARLRGSFADDARLPPSEQRLAYLHEIADGAFGDDPATRGRARDELDRLRHAGGLPDAGGQS